MKFVVSSTELLSHLAALSRVISSKSTMPILDNFLFQLSETALTITASDLESTLITSLELDNIEGEGSIAVPAKLFIDTLKESGKGEVIAYNIRNLFARWPLQVIDRNRELL